MVRTSVNARLLIINLALYFGKLFDFMTDVKKVAQYVTLIFIVYLMHHFLALSARHM